MYGDMAASFASLLRTNVLVVVVAGVIALRILP